MSDRQRSSTGISFFYECIADEQKPGFIDAIKRVSNGLSCLVDGSIVEAYVGNQLTSQWEMILNGSAESVEQNNVRSSFSRAAPTPSARSRRSAVGSSRRSSLGKRTGNPAFEVLSKRCPVRVLFACDGCEVGEVPGSQGELDGEQMPPLLFVVLASQETLDEISADTFSSELVNAIEIAAFTLRGAFALDRNRLTRQLSKLAPKRSLFNPNRASETLSKYVGKLFETILDDSACHAVSIFYRHAETPVLTCLNSTGLTDTFRNTISGYHLDECLIHLSDGDPTATTYWDDRPSFFDSKKIQQTQWKYLERTAIHSLDSGEETALACFPLRRPSRDEGETPFGVLRVHVDMAGRSAGLRHISMLHVQDACELVAPYLTLLTDTNTQLRANRTVKHDVSNWLSLIAAQHRQMGLLLEKAKDRNVTKRLYRRLLPKVKTIHNASVQSISLAELWLRSAGVDGTENDYRQVESVDIATDILRGLVPLIKYYAENESDVTVDFSSSVKEPCPLQIDKSMVERALFNVIVNAVNYAWPNTTVRIHCSRSANHYRVSVENDGDRIPKSDVEAIFSLGYRGKKAREHRRGAGCGLYIAREAMSAIQGDIRVESAYSPIRMTLSFPLSLQSPPCDEARSTTRLR